MLASYAICSARSRGRSFSELEHPHRTCFQRDRDRIIHSAAFRRLEAKTQVYIGDSNDYYRTRLTHTIEVAQIARTIARTLAVNEDLAEAIALAHDLGHPPYGHAGEAVLNELMADYGGFEHNHQSLRTVDYLEHPYPSFRGLNLSYETRRGLAKHQTRYDHALATDEFEAGQASLEGQIADLADAIAYNSHDLDDAMACGFIGEEDLKPIRLYQRIREAFLRQFPDSHRFARQLRCAKAVIDTLVTDCLGETVRRLTQWQPQSPQDIAQAPDRMAALSTQSQEELAELEVFLLNRVYLQPRVRLAGERARLELSSLFEVFVADTSQLPIRYQQRLKEQGTHRVVCDYLAGMTDRFCQRVFQQLTGE